MSTGKRGPGFKPFEDSSLCLAWTEISTDSSVGTNQDSNMFYNRVKAVMDTRVKEFITTVNKKRSNSKANDQLKFYDRSVVSIASRFQLISHDVQ